MRLSIIILLCNTFTDNQVPLFAAAGIWMTGQQSKQVPVFLYEYFFNFIGVDNLNLHYPIFKGFPEICNGHRISNLQLFNITEVACTAVTTVTGDDTVGVIVKQNILA